MTKINGFQPLLVGKQQLMKQNEVAPGNKFVSLFSDALANVNEAQKTSEVMTNKLITGEVKDVHEVMIASQKANLSLQLTVEVRNKVIESYQEIMRMQV
jgi:flagellar hook-basal body complex protein FliE